MFVLAVTGGIGSGKSEAARHFAGRGAVVLDLDVIAKRLLLSPGRLHDRVAAAFPEAVGADGSLDPAALARVAFADAASTARLDALVHPAVAREVDAGLQQLRLLERQPETVVIDVPLLAEAPALAELADHVLAIEAPEELRVERCASRGMDADECRRRMARQAPDVDRRALADTVIVNDGPLESFHAELDGFWEREVGGHAA